MDGQARHPYTVGFVDEQKDCSTYGGGALRTCESNDLTVDARDGELESVTGTPTFLATFNETSLHAG